MNDRDYNDHDQSYSKRAGDGSAQQPASALKTWMDMAIAMSNRSTAPDKRVGAIAVDPEGNMVGYGFNHNVDEDNPSTVDADGRTRDTTLHAEDEMLQRAMDFGHDLKECTIYMTHSPCMRCAARLKRAKVRRIYFLEEFKEGMSHAFLLDHDIELRQVFGINPEIDKKLQSDEDYLEHLEHEQDKVTDV